MSHSCRCRKFSQGLWVVLIRWVVGLGRKAFENPATALSLCCSVLQNGWRESRAPSSAACEHAGKRFVTGPVGSKLSTKNKVPVTHSFHHDLKKCAQCNGLWHVRQAQACSPIKSIALVRINVNIPPGCGYTALGLGTMECCSSVAHSH